MDIKKIFENNRNWIVKQIKIDENYFKKLVSQDLGLNRFLVRFKLMAQQKDLACRRVILSQKLMI